MSNVDDLPKRTTPPYAVYQRDIFLRGAEKGELPEFSTDPDELEASDCAAHPAPGLPKGGWLYASSNAGVSWTHKANRDAFFGWKIVPRMLVDTNKRDMSCTLKLGKSSWTFDGPLGFAPIGINKIYHPLGELNAARVAGELNLPYCLSTAGSQPIADVASAHNDGARGAGREAQGRFFQLYWPHNMDLTRSLLEDAVKNGFEACILTTDTWQLAWRHGDIAAANYAFYRGIGHDLGKANPVFRRMCAEKGIDDLESPEAGQYWIDNVWHGRAWSWDDLPELIKLWKELSGDKPFVIKGIQSVEDARRAADTPGVDGIVVSNHAGRQVDGAIGSLDALEAIVRSGVGEKVTVMFDSGVRSAADVFKALSLGAQFVFVGRPWVYGMSINGAAGVRHVMRALLAEYDILLNVAGWTSTDEVKREGRKYLVRTGAGGGFKL
ncbi:FMN-dependent dehydrogenase [Rhodotorula diobovata]|uniref:FMN-dependent dehydrogenase n=1 Tax=Rhodotorula diobovata TaxID=5288 RepID=A0A5C5FYY6_9BASI|nr:FMN-dependent dehydrogenase [Rhodotorula diobovata]